MNRLIAALLTAAAFALVSAPANAKESKGAPKELVGTYLETAEQCRSYLRTLREEGIKTIDEKPWPYHILNDRGQGLYYSGPCDGRDCPEEILSYVTRDRAYVLTVRYQGLYGSHKHTISVIPISKNKIKVRHTGAIESVTLLRCSRTPFEPGASIK